MKTNEFLLVKEAAELLGVSANTIRAWASAGKLQEYRHPVNNYRLYKQAELERILKKLEKSRSTETQVAGRRRPK